MAIHGPKPMARARSAPAHSGYRGLAVMTPKASVERTPDCARRALAALHVKVESQPSARSAASAASWPMVTDAANGRLPNHAGREAARVHPISEAVAAARPRAAVPTRLSSGGCGYESLAADRRPRGNNSARQFAIVGSRGPYPGMLVGVSGSDVYDHQIRQIDHTTILGRQRLSQSAAPMPTGILGSLW
jgi:hypothetical protein